jgi:hypothetical protein
MKCFVLLIYFYQMRKVRFSIFSTNSPKAHFGKSDFENVAKVSLRGSLKTPNFCDFCIQCAKGRFFRINRQRNVIRQSHIREARNYAYLLEQLQAYG